MKVTKQVGKGFKSLIDFPRWMGWNRIKTSAKDIKNLAQDVMSPDTPKHKETFEEAIYRLNLSEKEIKVQIKRHFITFLVLCSIALSLFIYSIYLLLNQHIQGFFLGIFTGILAFSFAFREHFYYFQMKKRKLGCTLQEWIDFVLGRTKK